MELKGIINGCPKCGHSYETLADEVGMHPCPACKYFPIYCSGCGDGLSKEERSLENICSWCDEQICEACCIREHDESFCCDRHFIKWQDQNIS